MKPTQFITILLAALVGGSVAKFWPQSAVITTSRKILLYQSPMHPWVKSDIPGQCTVCGMDLVPVYEGGDTFEPLASGMVLLPPGSPNVVGVKTAEVRKQALARTLRVTGMIVEDESRHGILCAPVDGRIDGLAMTGDGDRVNRSQPLVTLFSRTLLNAANDYKIAHEQNSAAVDQTKRRLEQYGLVWEQIKVIPQRQPEEIDFGILSPLTGTIVKSYVSEGQYVKEGDRLFEIADFTKMWFWFSAYELDAPEVLSIPRRAVLWSGGNPRVYVEQSAGNYQRREIKLGRAGDASWEVQNGLKEGERGVEAGNMLIDGQAQLNMMATTTNISEVMAISTDLKAYLIAVARLNTALSNDDLAAAILALEKLPASPEGLIKTPAPSPTLDLKTLRKAFLPWSQEISTFATKLTKDLPGLRIFRCPMTQDLWPGAPANAQWIQLAGELHNPYWGEEMQDCGMEVKP